MRCCYLPIYSIIGLLFFGGSLTGLVFLSIEIAKPYKKKFCSDKYTGSAKVLNVSYDKLRDYYTVEIEIYSQDLRYPLGQRTFSLNPKEMNKYNISCYYQNEELMPIYWKCLTWGQKSVYGTNRHNRPWFERYTIKVGKPWYIILLFIVSIVAVIFTFCCFISGIIVDFDPERSCFIMCDCCEKFEEIEPYDPHEVL